MLIDSNIIIYAARPEHADLRAWIAERVPAVSAISYVEVLGYHRLTGQARQHLEAFFAAAPVLPLSEEVLEQAVRLRQLKKMALGDALVAATALVHGLTLVTRNTRDFDWVSNLSLLDPFRDQV
ncbi:MAG: type II toxin-antitoxin system VapC family toxin [Anaerolineae bacterium]|nr:type II toxin-antitoxin system VapC family toxin [Anaerolineae bacterium]